MLPERSLGCQYAAFGGFGRLCVGLLVPADRYFGRAEEVIARAKVRDRLHARDIAVVDAPTIGRAPRARHENYDVVPVVARRAMRAKSAGYEVRPYATSREHRIPFAGLLLQRIYIGFYIHVALFGRCDRL